MALSSLGPDQMVVVELQAAETGNKYLEVIDLNTLEKMGAKERQDILSSNLFPYTLYLLKIFFYGLQVNSICSYSSIEK